MVPGLLVLAAGLATIGVAVFADDSSFVAPRYVVALVGALLVCGGLIPIRSSRLDPKQAKDDHVVNALGALVVTGFAAFPLWLLVTQGPDSGEVSSNLPLWLLPESIQDTLHRLIFYGVLGSATLVFGAAALVAWRHLVRQLGAAGIAAAVLFVSGWLGWVLLERAVEAQRPREPLVHLSFDTSVTDGVPLPDKVEVHGDEVALRPGVRGQAVFIGGTEDWIDCPLPDGLGVGGSLTLELWLQRESWINPYRKGSGGQTVVDLELANRPSRFGWLRAERPSVSYVTLGLALLVPSEKAAIARDALRPDDFLFRPYGSVGDTRIRAHGLSVPAGRWTHLAVVYDHGWLGQVRFYIDGVAVGHAVPKGSGPRFARLNHLRLGTRYKASDAFRGRVDEVKLYGRALDSEEIAASAAARP